MAQIASGPSVGLVLDLDPDLGSSIDHDDWELARRACRGELVHVPRGSWPATSDALDRGDLVGCVIVEGLLAREICLRDRRMVELLGCGDVLQPPLASEMPRLATEPQFTVVSDLVLLVLGQSFITAAARWPSLLSAVQRRLEAQRERLAVQGLIAHLPNAEHRLLAMLWHLADRWGYVSSDGIVLPWPLNHEILAQLIGARRPTVTIAVRSLEVADVVHRRADGSWLLTATAEQTIDAIARPPTAALGLGDRLLLYRRISETTPQTRALRAEARQIRQHRHAPTLRTD